MATIRDDQQRPPKRWRQFDRKAPLSQLPQGIHPAYWLTWRLAFSDAGNVHEAEMADGSLTILADQWPKDEYSISELN